VSNVLIIGSGGREHALAYRFQQEGHQSFCIPGNIGMKEDGITTKDLEINVDNIRSYCLKNKINKILIGPEKYLVNNLGQVLRDEGFDVIAPSAKAAQLEASKSYSKSFMHKYKIPTAKGENFSSSEDAFNYYSEIAVNEKAIVKVSGLASGKGVFLPESLSEAREVINSLFDDSDYFIKTDCVVIEERLYGEEISVFYFIKDGKAYFIGQAKDHKRLYENDEGPNTGGMGCVSLPGSLTSEEQEYIENAILMPTIKGMTSESAPYSGFLFLGLMKTDDNFKVIEYNCRLGDPETQTILPLIDSSLYELFFDNNENIKINKEMFSVHVVCTSKNYSSINGEKMLLNQKIDLPQINDNKCKIYFAGVAYDDQGQLINSGGRVLGVTSVGNDFVKVKELANSLCDSIKFEGKHFRRDIGND
tara:strand:- start:35832 stop:37088 length:1257 start_codon:yes stop_codon:yes gene_type:complete